MERHHEEGDAPERPEPSGQEAPEGDGSERKEAIERKGERTEQEVREEGEHAKEQVAEAAWRRPVEFVGDVFSEKLVPYVKRFLERFGALDDDALPDGSMREARDKAREAAEKE